MEDVLSDWEHLLSSSTPPPPPPPPPPASTTTSFTSHDPFLTVFPPVNHEDLPVAPPLANSHHHHHHHPPSATSPISPESPLAGWIGFPLELLYSKVVAFFSNFRSRVLLLSYPSHSSVPIGGVMAGASLTGLGLWIWWRRRRRRRRGSRDDTIEHLNLLIREKDEKIIELLLQVAQLNKLLLARYRVPVARVC